MQIKIILYKFLFPMLQLVEDITELYGGVS